MVGEPGSGKTTLGTALARELRVPFLARDDVRTGRWFTSGAWSDAPGPPPTREEAVETFLALVERFVSLEVSCVAEYVFRSDAPEALDRITSVADCVVVRTHSTDSPSRRAARDRTDRLLHRASVLESLGHADIDGHACESAARMEQVTADMRIDLDLPTIDVRTDDGWVPAIHEIIDFVARR